MPTVTFMGPFPTRRRLDKKGGIWHRGVAVEVSQEWLNQWRSRVSHPKYFKVEGDAGETVDFGDDGIPDSGWTKKDIAAWLADNGTDVSGYNTKKKLLDMVDTVLNPPAPEPEVVEEVAPEPEVVEPEVVEPEVVEPEVVEETIVEEVVAEDNGDEQ